MNAYPFAWVQPSGGSPVPAPVSSPNDPRTTSQCCGNNWIDTFAEAGATNSSIGKPYFSTSNQLPFLMVGTWDDSKEGTEVETGIDVLEHHHHVWQHDHGELPVLSHAGPSSPLG